MSRVFYEVEPNTPAWEFCNQHAQDTIAKRLEFFAYAESKGAIGTVGGFGELHGLIFDYDAEIPAGLKQNRRRSADGKTYYVPASRSPEGKALEKEIEALGSMPSQSGFAKNFGLPTSLDYKKKGGYGSCALTCGGMFERSLIAWPVLGEYWVVLPDYDKRIAEYQADGYTVEPSTWKLPLGLKRSSEARYDLACAVAKVREEEAA